MRIGEIERVGEREIPMPNLTPQEPPEPAPQRERKPRQPERVFTRDEARRIRLQHRQAALAAEDVA
jgi:hypothetical protein